MISVVIAAYNEEASIEETVSCVGRVLQEVGAPFEIIVVNDGSTDGTAAALSRTEARVVTHPHNVGYGRSLKDGISAARYETIVITDADMTYPFDQVPALLAKYREGFDMVVGARTGEHYRESPLKSPLRQILRFIVEFTAGRKIPDINSGLRIFHRDTAKAYFAHLCDGFSFTTSITLGYMMTGRFVAYVPIPYDKRRGQSKVKLLRDSLRTMQYILQAITYYNPLKAFILFSGSCILLAICSFCVSLFLHLKVWFILGCGSLLVALLVLCLGLIADLLKQILQEGKGR